MQLSKIVLAASAVWTGSAQAIPAFARGGGKTEKISDFLEWSKYFPVTALVNARPYDKKDSGDFKLRAIHEVELMVAGQLSATNQSDARLAPFGLSQTLSLSTSA